MDALRQSFASAVRERRQELGLSQERLGFSANMDQTGVSLLELEGTNISLDKADAIAAALGTTVVNLLGESSTCGPAFKSSVTFCKMVRHHRVQAGLNQRQLAIRAHVDRNYVSAIEMGRNVRMDTVEKFAVALGVPPARLLADEMS